MTPEALAAAFNARDLPGICATPYYFTPTFSKHQGQVRRAGAPWHVPGCRRRAPASGSASPCWDSSGIPAPMTSPCCPPHTEGGRPFISLLAGHRELERPDWDGGGAYQSPGPGRSRLCRPQSGLPPVLTRCFYAYIARNDPAGKTGPAIGRRLSGVRARPKNFCGLSKNIRSATSSFSAAISRHGPQLKKLSAPPCAEWWRKKPGADALHHHRPGGRRCHPPAGK